MPIDINDIRKGRRRDWDKLQDPVERKRQEQEAKQKAREARKARSAQQAKRIDREEREEREAAKWKRTKVQVGIILGLLVAFVGITLVVEIGARMLQHSRVGNRMAEVDRAVASGNAYHDLSDPVGALGTWRSAWNRRDGVAIVSMYSPTKEQQETRRGSRQDYLERFQSQLDNNGQITREEIVAAFAGANLVRWPGRRWSDGELAVFACAPMAPSRSREAPAEWVVAFSWHADTKQWRTAELRKREGWRDSWYHESQIRPITTVRSYGNWTN